MKTLIASLLMLVVPIAVLITYRRMEVNLSKGYGEAYEAAGRLGAYLRYDDDGNPFSLNGSGNTDEDLVHLKKLKTLKWLTLRGDKITDAGLVHLKGLTQLKSLTLRKAEITDAGLVHLKGLTNLEDLLLFEAEITDAGLEHLKGLTCLKSLHTDRLNDAEEENWRRTGLVPPKMLVSKEAIIELRKALPHCKYFEWIH